MKARRSIRPSATLSIIERSFLSSMVVPRLVPVCRRPRGGRPFCLAIDGTPNGVRVNCDHMYANGLLAVPWAELRWTAHRFGIPAAKRLLGLLRPAENLFAGSDERPSQACPSLRTTDQATDMSRGGAT